VLLRGAPRHLAELVPAGYVAIGSGGKGTATFTPWFGLFDPDETTSPERGLYLCFLFSSDLSTVTLTLMQGISELDRSLGRSRARERLAQDATSLRAELPEDAVRAFSDGLSLGYGGYRQLGYEAGCLLSRAYYPHHLPSEAILRDDLRQFLVLYQMAVEAKRRLLQSSPGALASASPPQTTQGEDPLRYFKPKDESDYIASLAGRVLIKARRHEWLIRQYGTWLSEAGFIISTAVHPRDLVAWRDGREWLIEAKVLYLGNATEAPVQASVSSTPTGISSTHPISRRASWHSSRRPSELGSCRSSRPLESCRYGTRRGRGWATELPLPRVWLATDSESLNVILQTPDLEWAGNAGRAGRT
jgi:hypothetical protein